MPPYVYYRNQFMPLEDAKMSILTHALHYGTGCFDGIRGNWNEEKGQLFLFRVKEHYERLRNGCRLFAACGGVVGLWVVGDGGGQALPYSSGNSHHPAPITHSPHTSHLLPLPSPRCSTPPTGPIRRPSGRSTARTAPPIVLSVKDQVRADG